MREKDRERNINVLLLLVHPQLGTWSATQKCALTGNGTCGPSVRRLALSPLSHTSQGRKLDNFNKGKCYYSSLVFMETIK